MERYTCCISFEGVRHCLTCPLRDAVENDSCWLQDKKDFDDWDDQMANCPLIAEGK